ncbi:MAG: peptidylprolyl isomerase, partial [Ignavibacteriae bacterium]|nr:peptidylprolyl isomerase [Ignavibacteriota bacterium]
FAEYLGVALQLTNILRDVKKDYQEERIYLPAEDMREFGYTEEDLKNSIYNDNFKKMMKRKYFFYGFNLLVIALIALIIGCSSKKKDVIAELGDEKIYLYEFENQYLKSIGNNLDTAKTKSLAERKEYLELMIKFRLKVKDAKDKGFLNSPEVQKDLGDYKKNFISTFLVDKVEPKIKELWERKKFEIRASHILINLPQTTTPEDSVKAFLKADTVIKRLKKGEDFDVVAREMSDDQSAKTNSGDLYYFTAGMTVPEFEDAIYDLKIGEYTKKPVRTMFGLHIVKLTDKKKRNEGIRAAHILIQDIKDTVTGKVIDSTTSYNKAKDILARIRNGEDFTKLATELSEDPGSKPRGGDLGFFDRRRMVQSFDSTAFSLKVGQVSDLVRTPFGWHIIKLLEVKEYQPFEKQKEGLKSEFKRSPGYKQAYTKFLNYFASKIDSNKIFNDLKLDSIFNDQDKQKVLATYKGGDIKITDIIQYFNVNKEFASNGANYATVKRVIEGCSDTPILNLLAVKEKIEKDEDYLDLYNEYQNGLLSFKIDQEELWSKIKITDQDIQTYYEANKQKYTFTENNEQKFKPVDEVKSEISQTLQQEKFKELEKNYIDGLKQKYPVKIHDNIIEKAFKN